MSFLAPLMLLGSAAVAVPIALHFFYKARHRPLPWAAMEFLRQSIEQTSKRLKFQELVLLILRCLVVVALALALSRLACRWGAASGRGDAIDAVLVFDTSYSMGAQDGEKTRMERAQEAALGLIDELPPRSTVQIVTCSDRATAIRFTPTNLDQARQVVRQLEVTSLSGDMLPGLAEAHAALDRTTGGNKELYVFSDMQKSGWERQAAAVKAKAAEIKPRGPLVLVRCGGENTVPANVAVTDITFPGGIPHTGTRMPFTVLLKNTGRVSVSNVAVTLEVDGERQEVDTGFAARIEPGTTFPVTLTGKLAKAGNALVTARIGQRRGDGEATAARPDDLPGDNRFDKIVPVRDRVRVLLVDGSLDTGDPAKAATFFLRNALAPAAEATRESYFVRVTETTPDLLSPAQLADADICVLANVPASSGDRPGIPGLPPEFAERLEEFVKAGGGLVLVAGEFVVPERYNALLGPRGLLPFPLGPVDAAPADRPRHPAPDSAESPSFLSAFREPPLSTTTGFVEVAKSVGVNEAERGYGGRVLLRLDTNAPLIASRQLGEGEVLFVATALDDSWGNWPALAAGSSYLAMVQKVLAHLTGRGAGGTNRVAGEALNWTPPAGGKAYEVVRPDRTRQHLGPAAGEAGAPRVVAADTMQAGVYQMAAEGESTPTGPRFAVVPDLRESENLEAMADAEFEQAVGFKPVMIAAGAEASREMETLRSKRELTVWLLLLVFALAAAECVWAWKCGRAA